jgi:hypothetical protein
VVIDVKPALDHVGRRERDNFRAHGNDEKTKSEKLQRATHVRIWFEFDFKSKKVRIKGFTVEKPPEKYFSSSSKIKFFLSQNPNT